MENSWMAGNMITWDMVHYDVQLYGGAVLHRVRLLKWLPVRVKPCSHTSGISNALTGKGVRCNSQRLLSKRDSEWMGPLYMFHGLSVIALTSISPILMPENAPISADITFGTNNEFGFDYLRTIWPSTPRTSYSANTISQSSMRWTRFSSMMHVLR